MEDKAQYDDIAEDYSEAEEKRPERIYLYDPSLFNVIGDLKGKSVLDFACGDGIMSRKFKLMGASEVIGVDESKEMIKIAERKEKENPLGIKYIIGKVSELGKIGDFDIVVGGYLLHYSRTKEELLKMSKDAFDNLKRNGRFIAINENPDNPLSSNKKYGSTATVDKVPIEDGDRIKVTLYTNGKEDCSFFCYHWSKGVYEEALRKTGFKGIKWHNLKVSEEGLQKLGKGFWEAYYKEPCVIIIECFK